MYPTVGLRGRAQRHRLSGHSQVTIERASTGTVTTNVGTNREVERFRERTSQVRTNLLNNISRISAHNLSGNNRDRGELLRFNVQQVQTEAGLRLLATLTNPVSGGLTRTNRDLLTVNAQRNLTDQLLKNGATTGFIENRCGLFRSYEPLKIRCFNCGHF